MTLQNGLADIPGLVIEVRGGLYAQSTTSLDGAWF